MNQKINYERNKKYFEQGPMKPIIILFVIGIVILLIGAGVASVGGGAGGVVVGIILIAVGALLIYLRNNGPSDSEIDQQCFSMVSDLKERALQKIGLDIDDVKEIEPITFDWYFYKSIGSRCILQLGKDNILRSSNYEGVVFFFSANQVYCFTFRFSLINQNETNSSTDEYFYKDIVSASTATDTVTYPDKSGTKQSMSYEYFKLTTSGGTSIEAAMRSNPETERAINGMKNLLRNKKAQ